MKRPVELTKYRDVIFFEFRFSHYRWVISPVEVSTSSNRVRVDAWVKSGDERCFGYGISAQELQSRVELRNPYLPPISLRSVSVNLYLSELVCGCRGLSRV